MIRLHDSLVSGNGYKVRLLLTQLGIPFERIEYDLARGEAIVEVFLRQGRGGRVCQLFPSYSKGQAAGEYEDDN